MKRCVETATKTWKIMKQKKYTFRYPSRAFSCMHQINDKALWDGSRSPWRLMWSKQAADQRPCVIHAQTMFLLSLEYFSGEHVFHDRTNTQTSHMILMRLKCTYITYIHTLTYIHTRIHTYIHTHVRLSEMSWPLRRPSFGRKSWSKKCKMQRTASSRCRVSQYMSIKAYFWCSGCVVWPIRHPTIHACTCIHIETCSCCKATLLMHT